MADDTTQTTDTTTAGDDAGKRAAFERDQERARNKKLQSELEELRKLIPSDEERKRAAEAIAAQETAEETRKRKDGEWDALRAQINEKHDRELKAARATTEAEATRANGFETELNDTLKGLAFAGAADLFGPTGKTVLLPSVAQAYFSKHVEVVKDETTGARRVVVKDDHGTVLVDPKTGAPLEFGRAMKELIEAHPDKEHLLRGSGKVGSNSPGGTTGGAPGAIDLSRPGSLNFRDPKVAQALRDQHAKAGGMVIGPAFDRLKAAK